MDGIDDGRVPSRVIRHHFGITSFGVNAFTAAKAGDRVINEHHETLDDQEELYLVQQGHATFELDGERVDAPAGTFVYAKPSVKRTAFAEEDGTVVVVVGGTPGKAYEVQGWEMWSPYQPLYAAGDYEAAIAAARPMLEADTQYGLPLYNLACCESLAGHKEDAIEHLRVAFGRREQLREFAKDDSDLDALRDEPAFKELVGS
jgi:tetratricopeptide (TPR) repeat protein